jgi:hypothetical protein
MMKKAEIKKPVDKARGYLDDYAEKPSESTPAGDRRSMTQNIIPPSWSNSAKAASRSRPAQVNSASLERQSTTGPTSFQSFLTPKGRPRVSPCYSGSAKTSNSPRRARATRPRPSSGSRTGRARASGVSLTGRTCPSRRSAGALRSHASSWKWSIRRRSLDDRRGGLAPCCKRAGAIACPRLPRRGEKDAARRFEPC